MENSKCKEVPKMEAKSFKKKFLQWTQRWTLTDESCNMERYTPDAIDLARLLQATGYRLRYTDRCEPTEMSPIPGVSKGQPSCRIIIMCPQSGLRMHLDAPTTSCKCPPAEEGKGHSWEIMGQGPTGQMESMGNTLIPSMERELSTAITEVLDATLRISDGESLRSTLSSSIPSVDSSGIEMSKSFENESDILMKTPVNVGITVTTPGAPDIPKLSPNRNTTIPGRYRSLDTLTMLKTSSQDLPEPGHLTPKSNLLMEANNNTSDQQSRGKKFISRSSPAVHSEEIQRSDTFISGDKQTEGGKVNMEPIVRSDTFIRDKIDASANAESPRPGPPPTPVLSPNLILEHSQSVQEAIVKIANIQNEIPIASDHVTEVLLENIRLIHRLSAIGNFPDVLRTAKTMRSTVRSKIRRSSTMAVPQTTPTSSRADVSLSSTKTFSSIKSKSISTTSLQNAGINKSSVLSVARSKSGLEAKDTKLIKSKAKSFVSNSIKSPTRNTLKETGPTAYVFRPNPNPKFAHVRSSIPKPSPVRKKSQL